MALAGDEAAWHRFLHREVPALEAEGWRIETDPGFRHRVVEAEGDWEASLGEKSGWWFSLELGIDVGGERVPLLPVLAQAVRRMRAARDGEDLLQGETLYAPLPDGRTLALPTERVRPMLETLVELYDPNSSPSSTSLDISLAQAAALAEVAAATRLRWLTDNRLLELIERLRQPAGRGGGRARGPECRAAPLPARRPRPGCSSCARTASAASSPTTWASARRCRRWPTSWSRSATAASTAPCLVVCPTSLVAELAARGGALRARPARAVAARRRPRASASPRSPSADLVLTTYALLPRDAEALLPVDVAPRRCWTRRRRSRTPTSQGDRSAPASSTRRHRLCLTGTPMENHLGELWSQFDFLMPGLLGDAAPLRAACSARRSRSSGDGERARAARRAASGRSCCAAPRSEVAHRAAAQDRDRCAASSSPATQRDLYETVRAGDAREGARRRSPQAASPAATSSCSTRC